MKQTSTSVVPELSGDGVPPLPDCVRLVLESQLFERSPTLRTLLIYLWRNREEPIGEYAIATEALGRGPSFDAKIDASVRVQVSRLRQRLDKFYQQEGKSLTERIVIPMGGHCVKVESVAAPEPVVAPPEMAPQAGSVNRRLAWACALLLVFSAGLGIEVVHLLRVSHAKAPEQAPRFWRTFFGGRQTRVILPTPIFFSYTRQDNSTLMVRDTSINEFADQNRSPVFHRLEKTFGLAPARLAQNYTVTSDTFASVSLMRYLDRFSLNTLVRSSAEAPLEALDTENVIAVGTWGTLTPLKIYLDRMSLRLGAHEMSVEIRAPSLGEPARVLSVEESPERTVWPGVVAVLPGPGGKTHLLVVASRQTSALVSTLTSSNGLEQMERLWRSKGSPEYYEMLIDSEMNGPELVRSWPVLIHPYRSGNGVTAGN